MSGWGAGYPGVPSDVAQKARAEAAAKAAEPEGEDRTNEASDSQGE